MDIYVQFDTVVGCKYWDFQHAFQTANRGTGGLECIREACEESSPREDGSEGAAEGGQAILEGITVSLKEASL
ncbi:hypothetical protein BPOR_0276g00010 [Botrytis porri]|uniref:Uncharacterized protein n=1 Tax=Botrytis porri TaxID=87229 RepID=A0A4Z1KMN9_9HELO|nr:hypothetical protein BPOR_0276g00010 [Botrytis porri]